MAQSIETAGGTETSGTGALAGPPAVEARPAATRSRPLEHHHRDLGGGGARAAVFGISDGLLTNVSLILGVARANPAPGVVRLAGLAGLVAGAFSMAAGEYISVTAQSELYRRELAVEREEIRRHPRSELQELVALYEKRGLRREGAEEGGTGLMRDPAGAPETHSREEPGIAPSPIGSPRQAALSSFGSFAVGALVPLLPWLFLSGTAAVVLSVCLAGALALAIGALVGYTAERPMLPAALRQLGIAILAASVTYG